MKKKGEILLHSHGADRAGGPTVCDDIITIQITDTQNLHLSLVEEIPIIVDTGGTAVRNPETQRAATQLTRTTF